ncbi:hypothetical protein DFH09DRAFT_1195318 [Mycena vulgaris]|nr:hypothetical protein DFH09DRAFT_1195318 [Mycena vulgaris]
MRVTLILPLLLCLPLRVGVSLGYPLVECDEAASCVAFSTRPSRPPEERMPSGAERPTRCVEVSRARAAMPRRWRGREQGRNRGRGALEWIKDCVWANGHTEKHASTSFCIGCPDHSRHERRLEVQ